MNFNPYAEEAKKRWGHTGAYRQSQERVGEMSEADLARIQKESDVLMKEIANHMGEDVGGKTIQDLIDRHFNNLRHFYEPNLELYRGLAAMYVDDKRFMTYFEKYAEGLAQFMHDAMIAYCDSQEAKK